MKQHIQGSSFYFSLVLLTGLVLSTSGSLTMADDLQVRGDAEIVPVVAVLETLWEDGGFTEGAAVGLGTVGRRRPVLRSRRGEAPPRRRLCPA